MQGDRKINFVASFPKAGTHLVAGLLQNLGLENTHWHLGYDFTLLADVVDGKMTNADLPGDLLSNITRRVAVDRNSILDLIKTNQFAVGHLPPHVINPAILLQMRSILLVRKIRPMLLSQFNYYKMILPEDPYFAPYLKYEAVEEQLEKFLEGMMLEYVTLWRDLWLWTLYRENMIITFENLKNPSTNKNILQRLAIFFNLSVTSQDIENILIKSAYMKSPTKNTAHYDARPAQWTDRCEELYVKYGCKTLDQRIDELISSGC